MISAERSVYINDALYVRRIREDSIVTKEKSPENICGHFTAGTELGRFREREKMASKIGKYLKRYIVSRMNISFDIYDELKKTGLGITDVKAAMKTTEDKYMFEFINAVR